METYSDVLRRAEGGDCEAQQLLAEALQAGGRAGEAAGWMQRAAAGGRVAALGQVGLWRLVGYGLPADPGRAIDEILSAAEAGDLFAMGLAATVLAGGVGVRPDVPGALRWLVRAAQAGDGRATCQLAMLAGPAHRRPLLARAVAQGFKPAARLGAGGRLQALDFDRILEAVDLSAFGPPPPCELQSEAPRIAVVPDLLTPWACDYVMALAGPALTRGKVIDRAGGESVREERTNTVMNFGLVDSDVVLELINLRLAMAAGMPPENAEGLGVLHYAPGEQYAPHVDYIAPTAANAAQLAQRGQRVRTLLVYLNDDFEGGATEFLRLDKAFRPPRGSGLVFDSVTPEGQIDPMTLHRGAPPTRGEKWVISKWFRTKALRPGPAAR